MIIDAIILAAGKSSRMTINKLSFELGKYSLINHTIRKFASNQSISRIFVVTDDESIKNNLPSKIAKPIVFVAGGDNRTQSVANALKVADGDLILVHDGARPFVSDRLINDVIQCAKENNSAVPILPLPDSVREIENDRITNFVDRTKYSLVQTPQGFNGKQLRYAYNSISNKSFYDDSEVYSLFFNKPFTVKGEFSNKKITYDNDLFGINAKIGIGYDIHKLQNDLPFVLGGVSIPYNKGFLAHSDGDVLIHSIMDALLGLANERDIGTLFPDSDTQYKNIASTSLLQEVKEILSHKGIIINNICAVIIAEKPKLCGYIDKMISKLANILKLQENQISINLTTNEKTGIIGNEEAIAVYAVCTGF